MKTRMLQILSVMMVLGLVLSACQPQVVEVEKEIVVTQVVKEEVEVEVEVEKIVEVEVEKIVEVEKGVDRAEGDILIAFANMVEGYAFSTMTREGIVEEATARGWETLLLNNNFDANLALTNVDTMVLQEVDVAIEFQLFEDINPAIMAKFNEAGIPMITIDIPAEGAIFAGVDNYEAGRMGGDWLGQYVLDNWDGDADLVLLLDDPTVGELPAKRVNGVEDGILAAVPGLKDKVLRQPGGGMREKGLEITRTVLTQYPDAHRIIISGIDDISLLGALAAAEELGREDDIIIFGQGGEEEALPEIRDPDSPYLGDVAYFFENYGKTVIAVAEKLINGEPIEDECPDWRDVCVFVDIALLTKDNINDIYPIDAAVPAEAEPSEFVFSWEGYAAGFDPLQANDSYYDIAVLNLYSALVQYPGGSTVWEYDLAESIEVSDDGLAYTVKLRDDVLFHDGTGLTSDDVKYTVDRLLALGTGVAGAFGALTGAEVVDDYTVILAVSEPFPAMMNFLPRLYIANGDLLKANEVDGDWGEQWLAENEAGSGPYMLTSFQPGQEFVMDKFDDYFKGWAGHHVDRAIGRTIKEETTRRLALEAGEIDFMLIGNADVYADLQGVEGIVTHSDKTLNQQYIGFNTQSEYLSDVRIRKALALAYDYDGHVEIRKGHTTIARGPLPPDIPCFDESIPESATDLDEAKRLMAEAGYPDGGFTLTMAYPDDRPEELLAFQLMYAGAAELGITVESRVAGWTAKAEMMSSLDTAADMANLWVFPAAPDPLDFITLLADSALAGSDCCNFAWYQSDEMDVAARAGAVETDPAKRCEYYETAQTLWMEDVAYANLGIMHTLAAHRDDVVGYKTSQGHTEVVIAYEISKK